MGGDQGCQKRLHDPWIALPGPRDLRARVARHQIRGGGGRLALRDRFLRQHPGLLSESEGAEVDWAGKPMGLWIVLGISGGEIGENQVNRSAVMTT
jgi:hypothetical protein